MMEPNEDDDEQDESPAQVVPWLTGIDAFTRFGKTAPELNELVKKKKVRTKKINGKTMYSGEDLENLPETASETQEASMAELVRAAVSQLAQGQKHDQIMFDKYMAAFDKVLQTQLDTINNQNKHIIELENEAMKMREAEEKIFNLEHERKLGELREQRKEAMQGKAMSMLQQTLGPWIAQKLGGKLPGAPEGAESGQDPRLSQLGQAVVGMVATMSDENFAALARLIPEAEYAVLTAIREGMKQ